MTLFGLLLVLGAAFASVLAETAQVISAPFGTTHRHNIVLLKEQKDEMCKQLNKLCMYGAKLT